MGELLQVRLLSGMHCNAPPVVLRTGVQPKHLLLQCRVSPLGYLLSVQRIAITPLTLTSPQHRFFVPAPAKGTVGDPGFELLSLENWQQLANFHYLPEHLSRQVSPEWEEM